MLDPKNSYLVQNFYINEFFLFSNLNKLSIKIVLSILQVSNVNIKCRLTNVVDYADLHLGGKDDK